MFLNKGTLVRDISKRSDVLLNGSFYRIIGAMAEVVPLGELHFYNDAGEIISIAVYDPEEITHPKLRIRTQGGVGAIHLVDEGEKEASQIKIYT